MCTLLDAHVHLHSGFSVPLFLKAAARNFDRAAAILPASEAVARVLAVCALADECPLSQFHETCELADSNWTATSPDEHSLVLHDAESDEERGSNALVLVAGRQVVTNEKLEVLSLFSTEKITHGLSLAETVDQVIEAGGVPVLPWGFGKWTFARRRKLRSLIGEESSLTRSKVLLGDNGCRWELWRSSIFSEAERQGIRVLAGSDPLPIAAHVSRPASFGSVLGNPLDFENPTKWLRHEVRQIDGSPATFGTCRSFVSVITDQISLRLKKS